MTLHSLADEAPYMAGVGALRPVPSETIPPQPLRRPVGAPAPFPTDALGPLIAPAVDGVADVVQVPVEIAAQSALAVASLSVQGHVDVEMPYGNATSPVSLFLLSVARSGDRKSAADAMLSAAIHLRERELHDEHSDQMGDYLDDLAAYDTAKGNAKNGKNKTRDEIASALKAVGPAPLRPRSPTLTATDPTIEGLHKYLEVGQPTFGLFADEGGLFVGGVGMSRENALRTAAGFSGLWDGSTIKRMRAGDGVKTMHGRRVSLHLMMQEGNASRWLSDPVLRDQGLFGRLLVAAPTTLAGQRLHRAASPASMAAIERFTGAALAALRLPLPYRDEAMGILEPRVLPFSDQAKRMMLDFGDAVERQLGPGGKLEPISSLAGKATAHAARLAAVLAAFENPATGTIDTASAARGVRLCQWYLDEGLRLYDGGCVSPEIARAESLLEWLRTAWPSLTSTDPALFSLPDVYKYGPGPIRDKATALATVAILKDHGWVNELDGSRPVNGAMRRQAYTVRGL